MAQQPYVMADSVDNTHIDQTGFSDNDFPLLSVVTRPFIKSESMQPGGRFQVDAELDQRRFVNGFMRPWLRLRRMARDLLAVAHDFACWRLHAAQLVAFDAVSPMGLLYAGPDGRCRRINRALERLTGRPLAQMRDNAWRRILQPQDRSRLLAELITWNRDQSTEYFTACRLRTADGGAVWAALTVAPVRIGARTVGYVACVEDITARRYNEMALLKSEQRLRLITDNIPALVAYFTPEERVAFANRRYEDAYGILQEELVGMQIIDVLGPDVYEQSCRYVRQALSGAPALFERTVRYGGAVRFERVSYVPDINQHGEVVGCFALAEDITALKQVEAQLQQLVRVDALTGIANRLQFNERLADAMRYSRRYGSHMALLFLDIDHFKAINDSCGHQGGDAVLRQFAQRLLACVRDTDTVARLAGDEFVIILEGLTAPQEAHAVAQKIIDAMRLPFEICSAQRIVTTSIGVAFCMQEQDDSHALLARADEALYRAKSAGRNTFETNPDSMDVF